MHPDDRETTAGEAARLAQGEPVVRFQNRYRASDGNYRRLTWNATIDLAARVIYAVARDDTEAEAAGDRLCELDALVAALFRNAAEPFLVTDPSATIVVRASDALVRRTGVDPTGLVGQHVAAVPALARMLESDPWQAFPILDGPHGPRCLLWVPGAPPPAADGP